MKIAKEGYPFIIPLAIISVLGLIFYKPIGFIFLILTLFIAYFFRDPHRIVINNPGEILSPADGRIMKISTVDENVYIKGPAIKVSIFLSVFNVHINRFPLDGKIEYIEHVPGVFKAAYKENISNCNERNYVGIISDYGKILVVQIAGLVARRIVCWNKVGDTLKAGDRFGMIKFSSCTELYLPLNTQIIVKEGDRVQGGISIIGRVKND